MNNDAFYKQIGQITYTFSMIDFLMATMAKDLGICTDHIDFFAKPRFKEKILAIRNALNANITLHEKIDLWLNEVDQIREKRNAFMHNLILSNNEEYRLYHYQMKGLKTIKTTYSYSPKDLEALNIQFLKIHNDGHLLWEEILDSN